MEPVVTHRTARVLASMSLLSLALFAGTGPASACPVTNPQCAVDGVKDTANNTVSGIQDKADETVSGIQDKADETVDDVNETVENVKEKADGAVGEVEKTIDGTVNPGGGDNPSTPNPPTEPGVGGPTTSKVKGGSQGPRERSNAPGRGPRGDARGRRAAGSASAPLIAPITVDLELDPPGTPVSSTIRPELSPGLGESAIEAIKDFAFPLLLTIVVGGFLLAQHVVDRKDPKLVFAPVDQDLLSFE